MLRKRQTEADCKLAAMYETTPSRPLVNASAGSPSRPLVNASAGSPSLPLANASVGSPPNESDGAAGHNRKQQQQQQDQQPQQQRHQMKVNGNDYEHIWKPADVMMTSSVNGMQPGAVIVKDNSVRALSTFKPNATTVSEVAHQNGDRTRRPLQNNC